MPHTPADTRHTPQNVTADPQTPTTGGGAPASNNPNPTAQTTQETQGYSTSENAAYGMGSQDGGAQSDATNNINTENRDNMDASAQNERKAEKQAGGPSPNAGNKPGGTSM